MLGTTAPSAALAASLGLPYVFALFLNRDKTVMYKAVQTCRNRFDASVGTSWQVMLALPVIVADSDAEAHAEIVSEHLIRLEFRLTVSYWPQRTGAFLSGKYGLVKSG